MEVQDGVLSPSGCEAGLELPGCVMGAPTSLSACREGLGGQGGECSHGQQQEGCRSSFMGSRPRAPPAPTRAGEAVLAQEQRQVLLGWAQLAAPVYRQRARAGRAPCPPHGTPGVSQLLLAHRTAGTESRGFGKLLLHPSTRRGANPCKGPGLGPCGALWAVFVFVPP